MIIKCRIHGNSEHVKRSKENTYRCKKCAVVAVQKRRHKVKQMSIDYKGGQCSNCGYDKCINALEFHHVNPDTKNFGIGSKGYTRSWEIVKKELDKCIILCANCHRELHSGSEA